MLSIDRVTYDAILAHARRDHPDEACGVVAGPLGSDRPMRIVPMLNAARSPTFYEFDSQDLLRLYQEMEANGEEPIVIYHSHTATAAYPSRTDISYASEPGRITCWCPPATRTRRSSAPSESSTERSPRSRCRCWNRRWTPVREAAIERALLGHRGADLRYDCR